MRRSFVLFLAATAALAWACSDEDTAGVDETPVPDAGADAPVTTPDGGDTVAPTYVLLADGFGASEMVAVNLEDGGVGGRVKFDGSYANVTVDGTEPWLVDQDRDDVYKLDPVEPWKVVGKWNVLGDDKPAGADANANASGVVTPAPNKAYVVRYNRNRIAVLDPTDTSSPAPKKYIDLSSLKQAGDDAKMDVSAATYVASKNRVYVVLGNADFTGASGAGVPCPTAALKSSVIAIDPTTDEVVSLGGTAPGGGIALQGYIPITPSPLVYDAAGDRLVIATSGCATTGSIQGRGIEAVSLATGTSTTLLDLNGPDFPSSFAVLDGNSAAVAFFAKGRLWNPSDRAIAIEIAGGVDSIAVDGRGAYVGTRKGKLDDGGAGLEVVSVQRDGGASVVARNPFTVPGGYISGIAAWSKR